MARPASTSVAANSARRRRSRRLDEISVETLDGALEFSDDPELSDVFYVVAELARRPQLIADLLLDTTIHKRDGRNRLPGSWALLYLSFVMSRHVDVQPFYNAYRSTRIWEICGFEQLPSRRTVHDRFAELERYRDAFDRFRAKLIAVARKHEPRIGEVAIVDGSAFTSNARIEHCCPDRDACRAAKNRPARFPRPAADEQIRADRQEEKTAPEDQVMAGPQNALEGLAPGDPGYEAEQRDPRYTYFWRHGHRYRCRDRSIGSRVYGHGRRPRAAWNGGVHLAFTDAFTGAPLADYCQPASINEVNGYIPGFERLLSNLNGEAPRIVGGDGAYHVKQVMDFNIRRGIGSVFPWRKPHPSMSRADVKTDRYDQHGVPRCQHCGGPGLTVGPGLGLVMTARGEPRTRFRCINKSTPACTTKAPQSISNLAEPRLLVGLSRLHPPYHQVGAIVRNREHVHRHSRDRHRVGGKDNYSRPRRVPAVDVQELRSAAHGCLTWFCLALRYGWIRGHRSHRRVSTTPVDGQGKMRRTLRARDRHGLDLPYGPAAERAGLAAPGSEPTAHPPPGHHPDGVDDDAIPF